MVFTFTDADGHIYQISNPESAITDTDVKNYNEFVNNIVHARQEDVVIKEAYDSAEEGEDD